jgi:hypothetical protein
MADAIFVEKPSSYFLQSLDNLLLPLVKSIASTHIESVCGSEQAIIRFNNGYGVCIFQFLHDTRGKAYQMFVVTFYGLGPNDYKLAQYVPIPEINWCSNFEDILSLCKRVSSLQNKVMTPSSHSVSPPDQ